MTSWHRIIQALMDSLLFAKQGLQKPLAWPVSQYHGHEWTTHNLETPRSRSWVWPKGKVIQSAQYHINSLPIHFTSIRPTIPEIEIFRNLTLKHPRSRSWVRSKVKVTYCIHYPTNALLFVSHQSDQPFLRYGQNSVWPWKNTSKIFN